MRAVADGVGNRGQHVVQGFPILFIGVFGTGASSVYGIILELIALILHSPHIMPEYSSVFKLLYPTFFLVPLL